MKYYLSKEVMPNDGLRRAFDALAVRTFGLSFEGWYQKGYWSDFNMPYTLFENGRAVANVSVNQMQVLWNEKVYRCIQLGTVMTSETHRRQGLSRYIMEEVIRDWENKCDGIFLFANDSVLDFYPKFGFERKMQYQFRREIDRGFGAGRKMNMDSPEDRELLKKYYEKQNPYSKVQVIHNYGLLMFYCIGPMKDCIYYSPDCDAVVIAELEKETLRCYDVFGDGSQDLLDILTTVAEPGIRTVSLEFTPTDSRYFDAMLLRDDDDALFMLANAGNSGWDKEPLRFPSISHT